jgi:hypothetical protein
MKKLLLFAAVAGLGLVSARPPPKGPDNGPREMRRHYPPCSRTVTDRCIQLYERGVRARPDREERVYVRDERRGPPDDYAMDERRGHHDDDSMDGHRRHRLDYAMDDRGMRRAHGDGDHRWCREHRAYHGEHRDRVLVERVTVERRPVRPVLMTARVTRVVGCRCTPAPRRHLAQRVRRAGERG